MIVTLYQGARAPYPIQSDDFADLGEFAEALADLLEVEAEDKLDLPAWSPHRLREGEGRSLEAVIEVSALAIDVDAADLGALLPAVEALDAPAIVYGSPSDDPEAPPGERRVRVIVAIDRPLTVAESGPARLRLAEALGLAPGCGVEGALDASRIFFAGRITGTAPRLLWTVGL